MALFFHPNGILCMALGKRRAFIEGKAWKITSFFPFFYYFTRILQFHIGSPGKDHVSLEGKEKTSKKMSPPTLYFHI